MAHLKFDVVIVGAGPAGITAAIGLARAGAPVLVLEAAAFPGAENWSGAVYFAENLVQPDILGPEAVRAAAYERKVVRRGFYMYNGHTLAGLSYQNPNTYRDCYTVLRPTYDHYLAELARGLGVTILTQTTADGLLRNDQNRVVGVHTNRGPVYADVVFLAEGDASHLVSKEGYERAKDPGAPHFLQGIKEVIELDPDKIEHTFGLRRGEGAAFEILLRNGSIHNRTANLNMGGFLYTNRASISLGLVMPLDNLSREFGGDHNRLMEWYKSLPEIRRLTGGGRSVAYGAKIIRGGGFRELPQLVDDGLAIGGAASGIGIDFPYPNFTGPATAMGRLFARAVSEIRRSGGQYSRLQLEEWYERPVRNTHYFKNVEFLQDWPRYIEHTRVFFGRAADLACGTCYIAGHRELSAGSKIWQLAKFVRETLPPKHMVGFVKDLMAQRAALGLNRPLKHPTPAKDGTGDQGKVTLECYVDGVSHGPFIWPVNRLWSRLPQALAAASDHLYRNDNTPLPVKLRRAIRAARRGLNLVDYLGLAIGMLVLGVLMPVQWVCEMVKLIVTRPSPAQYLSSFYQRTLALGRRRLNLDADAVKVEQPWEEKLSLIRYTSTGQTHIKVYRPEHFENRGALVQSPLWHVCPAKVYECATDDLGQSQVIVNFENCVKCETCWRSAPQDVDWTRQGFHGLTYAAPTEVNRQLLEVLARPSNGSTSPQFMPSAEEADGAHEPLIAKLRQFCQAVHDGPRYLDTGHVQWLQRLVEEASSLVSSIDGFKHRVLFARIKAHAKRRKFFWAEADARQLLELLNGRARPPGAPWAYDSQNAFGQPGGLSLPEQIDRLFPKQAIKDLERGKPFTDEQLAFLKSLEPTPEVLRELARKDVSFAVLVSGLAYAQVTSRPELADVPWIGLNTARRYGREFPCPMIPTADQVAGHLAAIVLGAGEVLLERCRQHAVSRVQFPGLFKDEDGHDGIIKFGAVKQFLSEMEAHVYRLRLLDKADTVDADEIRRRFGPEPGSLTYNAGQIIGGSAYSEDDIFSKYYRDSAALRYLLADTSEASSTSQPISFTSPPATELESELRKLLITPNVSSDTSEAHRHLGTQALSNSYLPGSPLQVPPEFVYRSELHHPNQYDYGDYLVKPLATGPWRFVPEMLHADAELGAYHRELHEYFTTKFWNARFDGLPYHRLVEKLHHVPLEDVRDMVAHGFTRMYIPKEFGGEGLMKAHYYILCPLSMRYADPSYALTIMAHSSIGTTPILLGLQQDLPRAKADLDAFLSDTSIVDRLRSESRKILRMLDSPEALKVKKVFTALGETVKADIGKKPMLRAVAADFLALFMDAGRAGLRMDLAGFKTHLTAAMESLDQLVPRAQAVSTELDRRAEAHKHFLRLISAGQISAFALTEPSAGSDSGGIQTRAVLKRIEVQTDADGSKYFLLNGEKRFLVDAATVDVSKIDYSAYDFATSTGLRKYEGRPFHDLGQIRRDASGEYYEYYEVNGAKMWITNGHVAGVFCLYARTPEGPTGFMVDRYAEGLVVGRDEEKMGQRGSPTNELGLTNVRIPRENVIGIEGRGQVNALETLNVGRMGLCVSAVSMMSKVLEQTRDFVRDRNLQGDASVQERIGTMAMELYGIESLAYELIGRADHHETKSVRTESAIGKYHASEALHRVIALAEAVMGFEGCTQLHEIEKHRRDARVLNIYEGTNEVQRFLILRDLVDHVLPQVNEKSEATTEPSPDPVDATRHLLLRALKRAVDAFGPQVWQNANFQPTMFKLAEISGWIKTMDAALWRTQWLRSHATSEADAEHLAMAEQACAAHVTHATAQIHALHEAFERELALLKQGLYPPEIRVAMLSLQAEEEQVQSQTGSETVAHAPSRPLHVVVVLNVAPVLSPQPRVLDGQLAETQFDFDDASRSALAQAVALRRDGGRLSVVAVAPRYAEPLLRRALALGADDAILVETAALPGDAHATARVVSGRISRCLMPCDLVVTGEPIFAAVLAGHLGVTHLGDVESFQIQGELVTVQLAKSDVVVTRRLPMVLAVEPAGHDVEWTIDGWGAALAKPLTVVASDAVDAGLVELSRFELPSVQSVEEKEPKEITTETAATLIRTLAGIESAGGADGNTVYAGAIQLVAPSRIPLRKAAVFVATEEHLDQVAVAARCAGALMLPLHVVVLGNPTEPQMRALAGRITEGSVIFVSNRHLGETTTADALVAALQTLWKDTLPDLVMADAGLNDVVARFARTFPRVQARYNVARVTSHDGVVTVAVPVYGGKVRRVTTVASLSDHPLVMTLASGATADAAPPASVARRVCHLPLELAYEPSADDLAAVTGHKPIGDSEPGIADAGVIIDVGYAIRNKENFDAVIEPLRKRLSELGVHNLAVGGTRKVVEELKLLGADHQIGQTGTAVNPQLIISIGVSGAPQHIDYIGDNATIIAINKDPEAPIMTLNKRRARPKVVPLVGDLYDLVPALTKALVNGK